MAVSSLTDSVKAVAAGLNHSCALLSDGTVKCWGDNSSGELGNGSTTDSSNPVVATGVTGALAISTGSLDTCVVLAAGTASCWGDNTNGKLGNGSTTAASSAVAVSDISGALDISAGASHSCALLSSNSAIRCWGDNAVGELGATALDYSSVPVIVSGLS